MMVFVVVVAVIFFFKQKTAYEIMPSLVGSEMCIRDRYDGVVVVVIIIIIIIVSCCMGYIQSKS